MISIKNIKYLELKKFDWKLFFSLIALSLVPFLLQTIETFVVSINISAKAIDVIGQIEWYDLIDETIQAFLIIPLYSILNSVLKNDKGNFANIVFKSLILVFLLYSAFSIVVLVYSKHLISFMNPQEIDLSLINKYLLLSTFAFMIDIVADFANVVFVVIGKSVNVYIFLTFKVFSTILSDFLIIPAFGVIGVGLAKILTSIILSVVALAILSIEKSIKISRFGKSDLVLIKDWSRIGAFSGLQQFIANVVYALMIVRIVNEVSESGNYWLCNNFIWGFLLLPVNALCEVIRKDCKDGYKNLRQSNYYIILFAIFVLWALSITFWMPFFKVVEHLENYRRIFEICIMMIPFFIPYSLQQVPDNIFIGLGKTKYNFINTALVNFIYYGVWFALYKTKAINFDMNMIILMFGFGMVVSCAISFIQEKVFFTKKILKSHPTL